VDAVIRSIVIYGFLLLIFRVSGKRTLAQITTFDFVLLLIIGEAVQQGLLGNDFSLTNALLVIVTLIGLDITMSVVEQRWDWLTRYVEGLPVVLVEHGRPITERMRRARVEEADIMERARGSQGLERMAQIKFAVLERDGSISVIPMKG
jgi:uncharacterized membrane protein YcaP (DUF421 family)